MLFRHLHQRGTLIGMCLRTIALIFMCVLCACGKKSAPPAAPYQRDECLERPDGMMCSQFEEALTCRGGEVDATDDCQLRGQRCVAPFGCVACTPNAYSCDGQQLLQCTGDGLAQQELELCSDGLSCSPGGCADLCERARRERSYIGCEYFPVFTMNNQLDDKFQPAVVVANPNLVPAEVTVTHGERAIATRTVAPNSVETIMLSFFSALRQPATSMLVRSGAYRLVASVPVTVHQFNPLLFELKEDCARDESGGAPGEANDKKCNSYSNDASLLVPSHALQREPGETLTYLAMSRASMLAQKLSYASAVSPGFVSVVNVSQQAVRVRIRSSAHTLGITRQAYAELGELTPDGDGLLSEPLPALNPGEELPELVLQPSDVVQLLANAPRECSEPYVSTRIDEVCPLGSDWDLTGTLIEADGPIQVIGGHNCAYVPFDRIACDHLEESVFPLDTWGTQAIVARPRAGDAQAHVVRVLSGADDNLVELEPALLPPTVLARGQQLEVMTAEHVIVRAQKAISVAQFLVGQNGEARVGDPSMTMAIPVEQYRSSYAFLSPATWDLNYVTVIARSGDEVVLDGQRVRDFAPIGDGTFQVANVKLAKAGAHEVHSDQGRGIGVQVYGFGDYASYMLPGGLDLRVLTVPL